MSQSKHKALVLGSTGLIGSETLDLLLKNDKYEAVYAVTRRNLEINNQKLIQIVADMDTIEPALKDIAVDHFFCCVGTTKDKTPDQTSYYKIDLDYPVKVSSILKNNGCTTICAISSIGANADSSNFYLKLKGEVEQALLQLGFQNIFIFRPSLLLGQRKEFRLMEKIAQYIYPLINPLLFGKMKNYRSIASKVVASAMINIATSEKSGSHIYQTQEIKKLA